MKVLAIIPARSGSRSIPDKNIQSLHGKPLLAYSIEHALESDEVNRIILSTDSEYYAKIARSFGAEVPFLRPSEISSDESKDYQVFTHTLSWLKENENYQPDIVVHLRPTSPFRRKGDIDAMVRILKNNVGWDCIRSVTMHKESAFKMWFLRDGLLSPVVNFKPSLELYNEPRQKLEPTYIQNACIDVVRYSTIVQKRSMTGNVIGSYVMNYFGDIDEWRDFNKAKRLDYLLLVNKVFCIDIDGVIAALSPGNDYNLAIPLVENINRINKLFDNGNKIILFTARGSMTHIDWRSVTEKQLKKWNVKYHQLKFEKPAADYYIDDRMLDLNDINFT